MGLLTTAGAAADGGKSAAARAPFMVRRPIDAPGTRLNLPAGGKPRFIVFVDTEEEFDWSRPLDRHQTQTTHARALLAANARFAAAGVHPVYLCDYPIVDNPDSGAIIRDMLAGGDCDIGAQLHPWVNPPFDEHVNQPNSFTGNLPLELQRAKLKMLTERIEQVSGRRPTVYRAGRYGIGPDTPKLLAEAGYRMDVSIRSRHDYTRYRGPDFAHLPVWPWRYDSGIVELPLSTAWIGLARRNPVLYRLGLHALLARTGLLSRVPLTPEGVPLKEALVAIKALSEEGVEVFSLSYHSPSLVPGFTPYVRDEGQLATFWRWWDGVFDCFARLGIEPIAYQPLVDALDRQ